MLPGIKLFDLTGQVAVVTGGSKGLGLAMAEGLASAGADVVLVSRNEAQAKAAAEQVAKDYGHRAIGVAADVSSQADTERMAAAALEAFGKIDILINNAGINIRGPIDKLTFEDFRKVQQTNVDGVWLACRAVVPFMKARKSGRIINVASTLGVVGLADRTPYATSKGAVVNMTRALAMELAPFNIPVNAICPGPFLTEMNMPIKDDPVALKSIVGAAAFPRWADLQEIQGAAIYLSSPAASFTTGSLVMVDGGWTTH
jgi:NAD(P)-dependent dehydrogenase (short-subunit alcohol dehydrogenase family)